MCNVFLHYYDLDFLFPPVHLYIYIIYILLLLFPIIIWLLFIYLLLLFVLLFFYFFIIILKYFHWFCAVSLFNNFKAVQGEIKRPNKNETNKRTSGKIFLWNETPRVFSLCLCKSEIHGKTQEVETFVLHIAQLIFLAY